MINQVLILRCYLPRRMSLDSAGLGSVDASVVGEATLDEAAEAVEAAAVAADTDAGTAVGTLGIGTSFSLVDRSGSGDL